MEDDDCLPLNEDELLTLIDLLKSSVAQQEEHIVELRTGIAAKKTPDKSPVGSDGLAVLQKKERQVKKELNMAKESKPDVLANIPLVFDVLWDHKIRTTIKETMESIKRKKETVTNLKDELNRFSDANRVISEICISLSTRVDEVKSKLNDLDKPDFEDESREPSAQRAEERELQEKLELAGQYVDQRREQLHKCLTNNFNAPLADPGQCDMSVNTSINASSRRSKRKERAFTYLSLVEILEILIEKNQNSHDPYVAMDRTWYKPYVEALTRFGIAVLKPRNKNMIRLEEYVD